jgi:hypothetical protein
MRLMKNTLLSRSSSAFYKTVIFLFALVFCLMIASCNGCSNSNSNHFQDSRAESPINPLVEEVDKKALEDAKKDTTLFRDMCRRLEGTWYYDLQEMRGISFNAGGGMTSINTEEISFKEWKILKGKIYFYYLEEQQLAHDRHQFLVDEAQITNLTPDNLTFVFRGRTYDCQRPPKKPLMTN